MKATLMSRFWKTNERTDLCKAIPLDTPLHMFIDPSAACNHSCKFCFNHDKSQTHHEIMKWETFLQVCEDLMEFPRKLKTIKLYGFGEPLLNRNFAEMIAELKAADVSDRIETTSNGWWLTNGISQNIINAGLDRLVVSVNGLSDEQVFSVTGARVDFEKYVKNLEYFYDHRENCILHIKTTDATVCSDPTKFFNIFGDICDEISIDTVVPIWDGIKSDTTPTANIYGNPISPVKVCPYIFYHMTVQANGKVSTCFMDWKQKNIIGDVLEESLVDIWNGMKLRCMRAHHLKGERSDYPLCANCGQLVYGQADCIDGCREELLRRI